MFLTLYYMRRYPCWVDFEMYTSISLNRLKQVRRRCVSCEFPSYILMQCVLRGVNAMELAFSSLSWREGGGSWPTDEDWQWLRKDNKKLSLPGLENKFLCLDGMHLLVPMPSMETRDDKKSGMFNGKHHCWAKMMLVLCDLRGRIIWTAGPEEKQEKVLFNDSNLRSLLRKHNLGMVSDAGFQANTSNTMQELGADGFIDWASSIGPTLLGRCAMVLCDKNAPVKLREEMRQTLINAKLASKLRIVVENVIGRLRDWKIASAASRWRGRTGVYSLDHAKTMRAVVLLEKYSERYCGRKPRSDDWKPPLTARERTYKYDGYIQPDGSKPLNLVSYEKRLSKLWAEYEQKKKNKQRKKRTERKAKKKNDSMLVNGQLMYIFEESDEEESENDDAFEEVEVGDLLVSRLPSQSKRRRFLETGETDDFPKKILKHADAVLREAERKGTQRRKAKSRSPTKRILRFK